MIFSQNIQQIWGIWISQEKSKSLQADLNSWASESHRPPCMQLEFQKEEETQPKRESETEAHSNNHLQKK